MLCALAALLGSCSDDPNLWACAAGGAHYNKNATFRRTHGLMNPTTQIAQRQPDGAVACQFTTYEAYICRFTAVKVGSGNGHVESDYRFSGLECAQ